MEAIERYRSIRKKLWRSTKKTRPVLLRAMFESGEPILYFREKGSDSAYLQGKRVGVDDVRYLFSTKLLMRQTNEPRIGDGAILYWLTEEAKQQAAAYTLSEEKS